MNLPNKLTIVRMIMIILCGFYAGPYRRRRRGEMDCPGFVRNSQPDRSAGWQDRQEI